MKCRNDIFMSKVGVNKLNNTQEVHFDVQSDLPNCRRIAANKYISTEASDVSYSRYNIPKNQFECMSNSCFNSGTLYNEGKKTVYKINDDATAFVAGIVTFYVMLPQQSAYDDANAILMLSSTEDFTDAWKYKVPLADANTASDGFTAVVVDLSKAPEIIGNGWTPLTTGAFMSVEIETAMVATHIGISSFGIFDELADFELSSHVVLGCVSSIDGTFDFEAAEATCFSGGYNTDDITTFEKTVTGKALTPNYMLLNPLMEKGEATVGFDNVTVQKTVEALPGTDYGFVTLIDMNQDECGFFSVAVADACNLTEARLERVSIPNRIDLDETRYQLIDNGDGTTMVLFNKAFIGVDMLISYPKIAEVEEWVMTDEAVGQRRVRMSYSRTYTDGVKYRFVYDNVLITSFPDAVAQEEPEFAFTVTIQKDGSGRFGRAYRILD